MKFSSNFLVWISNLCLRVNLEKVHKTMWVFKCSCKHWLQPSPSQATQLPARAPFPMSPLLLHSSVFFFLQDGHFRQMQAYDILVKQERYSARHVWISVRCALKQIVGKTKQCAEWNWH
jgi:hypothetical protein